MDPAMPYGQATELNNAAAAGEEAASTPPSGPEAAAEGAPTEGAAPEEQPDEPVQFAPPPYEPPGTTGNEMDDTLFGPEADQSGFTYPSSTDHSADNQPPNQATLLPALQEAASSPTAPDYFKNLMRTILFTSSRGA